MCTLKRERGTMKEQSLPATASHQHEHASKKPKISHKFFSDLRRAGKNKTVFLWGGRR